MCLNEIETKYKEEDLFQKSKNMYQKILNFYTNHEKLLLNYLMIIL